MGDHSDIDHTGLTGVGGTETLPESIIDAAGDLIIGDGANSATRLALGTAGQVLTVNAGATAPEWAAAGSGGGGDVSVADYPELYLPANGTAVDMSGAATGTSVVASSANGATTVTFAAESHQSWDVTQALGTGNFDVRARIISLSYVSSTSNSGYGGLCVTDSSRTASTRIIVAERLPSAGTTAPDVRTIVNASFAGSASYFGSIRLPHITRIARSSGTVTTYVSFDEGRNWTPLHSVTDSTNFQKVGFNAHNNTSGNPVFVVDWIKVV